MSTFTIIAVDRYLVIVSLPGNLHQSLVLITCAIRDCAVGYRHGLRGVLLPTQITSIA